MAESNGNGAAAQGPALNALVQYTKDLSFENPNAPQSLGPQENAPNISIQVNVNARQLAENDFEVGLMLEGSAGEGANTLFKFELDYAGVFRLTNIPEDQKHPVVMIECPRLLFPFVRRIVSDVTRDGGFPPLNIDNVDFLALYRQEIARRQAAQAAAAPTETAN